GDAGPVVLPPLAAMVVMRLGHHPFVGLVAAYAACLGVFSANILPGMADALALGFTEPAAQLINPDYSGNILMNYYFIAASTFFLLIVVYFVQTRITLLRLGTYDVPQSDHELLESKHIVALIWANIAALLIAVFFIFFLTPENGILRNQETGSIIQESPFMYSIVV